MIGILFYMESVGHTSTVPDIYECSFHPSLIILNTTKHLS